MAALILALATLGGVTLAPTPVDAATWAAADAAGLDDMEALTTRYLWCPPWAPDSFRAANYAVNAAASKTSRMIHPHRVGDGLLLRYDLRRLCPNDADLKLVLREWDAIAASDPYFYGDILVRVETKPYKASDGKTYTYRLDAIRGFSAAIPPELAGILIRETGCRTPIARADRWTALALSTTRGGRYYELMGWSGLDRDRILAGLGADPAKSEALEADQRVGLVQSGVTGKSRQVVRLKSLVGRHGPGDVWLTLDPSDEQAEVESEPLHNLLEFVHFGEEVIFDLPNGLHGFFICDAAGKLVREAPAELVTDHTVPAPHTARLQAAVSCIVCHGPDDGLRPAPNDVLAIAQAVGVLDDLAARSRVAALARIESLYSGNFDHALFVGREAYASAVRRACWGMEPPDLAAQLQQVYASVTWDMVSPRQAAYELGVACETDAEATACLEVLLPPDAAELEGVRFARLTEAMVRAGQQVRRISFEREYQVMLVKALATRKELGEVRLAP